ncbi:hypothetical protein DZE40_000517 [Clostridium beijerinckii]|nr:hypothetical protein [Clostridium beijerinckii]
MNGVNYKSMGKAFIGMDTSVYNVKFKFFINGNW